MFTSFLLPEVEGLQLEQVEAKRSCIALTVAMTAPAALCPVCRQPSHRVQSRYLRTIADVPWAGVPVRLQLHVRRFVCGNPECKRTMFCERLGPAIRAYARRTQRLEITIEQLGEAVGGEAGARLLTKLGMATSPTTVLRLLRSASIPARATPRVLGVDDWGATRSHRCSCKDSRKEDLTWGSAPKCPTRLNQVRLGQRSRVREDDLEPVRKRGDC
jgi:transposase